MSSNCSAEIETTPPVTVACAEGLHEVLDHDEFNALPLKSSRAVDASLMPPFVGSLTMVPLKVPAAKSEGDDVRQTLLAVVKLQEVLAMTLLLRSLAPLTVTV